MRRLDRDTAIEAGGWDARYAIVLAVATNGNAGAAIVDTNGDGADIDFDWYERVDGTWHPMSSFNIGESGSAQHAGHTAMWGRGIAGESFKAEHEGKRDATTASDTGWWLAISESTCEPNASDQR